MGVRNSRSIDGEGVSGQLSSRSQAEDLPRRKSHWGSQPLDAQRRSVDIAKPEEEWERNIKTKPRTATLSLWLITSSAKGTVSDPGSRGIWTGQAHGIFVSRFSYSKRRGRGSCPFARQFLNKGHTCVGVSHVTPANSHVAPMVGANSGDSLSVLT